MTCYSEQNCLCLIGSSSALILLLRMDDVSYLVCSLGVSCVGDNGNAILKQNSHNDPLENLVRSGLLIFPRGRNQEDQEAHVTIKRPSQNPHVTLFNLEFIRDRGGIHKGGSY